jgi:hypothetical protein
VGKAYFAGSIVNVEDYKNVCDAWIAHDGSMIYVTPEDHDEVAWSMFGMTVDGAEQHGYIHLSYGSFVYYITPPRPTDAQVNTVLLWCAARCRNVPDWCVRETQAVQAMSSSYRAMLRTKAARDMFYPNSGD